jgi:TRAP-type C4-dicarboxylate transport system permease small subunit
VSPALKLIIALGFVALVLLAALRARLERQDRGSGFFAAMARVEVGFIALMLLVLVALGCVQIVLRNAFHSGLLWADPLMRHLVLWLGAFGAALASARMRHISVDALSRLLPERYHPLRRSIVYGLTAVAGYLLLISTVRLVLDERQYGDIAFLGIRTWVLEAVLPLAFAIITYRTLVGLFLGRESAESQLEAEP